MDASSLKLFYAPKDRLRLTVGEEKSYYTVKPAWAAPLSRPKQYLSLLDGKGNEIVMLKDPSTLPPDSWEAVQQELHRRYMTAQVKEIISARVEYGATYWSVVTDRGAREFVTQSLQENAQWLSPTHLLLIDVDGNRFEIPDVNALDPRSKGFITAIL
jgi:hypothetical protein